MPLATLTFNLPEEQQEFDLANRALAMSIAIDEIGNEVFRPARKHGYPDAKLNELLEKCGDPGYELVHELERMFYEILNNHSAIGRY